MISPNMHIDESQDINSCQFSSTELTKHIKTEWGILGLCNWLNNFRFCIFLKVLEYIWFKHDMIDVDPFEKIFTALNIVKSVFGLKYLSCAYGSYLMSCILYVLPFLLKGLRLGKEFWSNVDWHVCISSMDSIC